MLAKADLAAAELRSGSAQARPDLVNAAISRIDLCKGAIGLTLSKIALGGAVRLEPHPNMEIRSMVQTLPATRVWHGHQLRLIIPTQQPISIAGHKRQLKRSVLVEADPKRISCATISKG